jgi:ABC-type sugar transport system ATPase subunit
MIIHDGENSMNSNDFVICTKGLSKSFGEVHALKYLDLRVPQKSIFAFA